MVISLRTGHGFPLVVPCRVVIPPQFPAPEPSFFGIFSLVGLIVSRLSCTVRQLATAPLSHLVPTVSPAFSIFFRESSSNTHTRTNKGLFSLPCDRADARTEIRFGSPLAISPTDSQQVSPKNRRRSMTAPPAPSPAPPIPRSLLKEARP